MSAMQIENNNQDNFVQVYNCIYIINCNNCNITYIGQTKNLLHLRINLYRSTIKPYNHNNSLIMLNFHISIVMISVT